MSFLGPFQARTCPFSGAELAPGISFVYPSHLSRTYIRNPRGRRMREIRVTLLSSHHTGSAHQRSARQHRIESDQPLVDLPRPTTQQRSAMPTMCEDCEAKHASFGLGAEKKRRWCGACAKAHDGAMYLVSGPKMCEDCEAKHAGFGLPAEKKRRWSPRGWPSRLL